jgi:hypothetical protein
VKNAREREGAGVYRRKRGSVKSKSMEITREIAVGITIGSLRRGL